MSAQPKDSLLSGALKPNANVLFRRLGDEIVLFHLGSDRFYELNGTAARFWELLDAGNDATQIQEKMLSEFEIDSEQFASEAEALLESLRQENLIVDE